MCRYKRQDKHPHLLAVTKALRGKKEGRNGKGGKGRRKIPWIHGLRVEKKRGMERRGVGTATWAPWLCKEEHRGAG